MKDRWGVYLFDS